jgi:hypothetical protein
VSHEALEMVADSWGNRLVPGGSPKPGQGIVEFLVEVCDPVGDPAHSYTINGYPVSDFYTPEFFDPVASESVRYSFTGQLARPRGLLPGGYLSWRDPGTRVWWQWQWDRATGPRFARLGVMTDAGLPLREQIDAHGTLPALHAGAPPGHPKIAAARERQASTREASRAQAAAVRERVDDLLRAPRPLARS